MTGLVPAALARRSCGPGKSPSEGLSGGARIFWKYPFCSFLSALRVGSSEHEGML